MTPAKENSFLRRLIFSKEKARKEHFLAYPPKPCIVSFNSPDDIQKRSEKY